MPVRIVVRRAVKQSIKSLSFASLVVATGLSVCLVGWWVSESPDLEPPVGGFEGSASEGEWAVQWILPAGSPVFAPMAGRLSPEYRVAPRGGCGGGKARWLVANYRDGFIAFNFSGVVEWVEGNGKSIAAGEPIGSRAVIRRRP